MDALKVIQKKMTNMNVMHGVYMFYVRIILTF